MDPDKFISKSAKSVRSRIGNIRSALPADMDLPAFWDYLKRVLAGSGPAGGLPDGGELAAVEELKRTKYDTWEWNFGRSPRYNLRNKRRWEGGTLEPCAEVDKGLIHQIVFYGDFLSVRPLDDITAALTGCPFRREDAAAVLDRFPLGGVFRRHYPGSGAGHAVLRGLKLHADISRPRTAFQRPGAFFCRGSRQDLPLEGLQQQPHIRYALDLGGALDGRIR